MVLDPHVLQELAELLFPLLATAAMYSHAHSSTVPPCPLLNNKTSTRVDICSCRKTLLMSLEPGTDLEV